jgi:glycosyltransferase involved in cell wall biosynthesis
MKILMLNHNVKWRGTFFRAFHFAKCLARRGHEVTLVTISKENRFRFQRETLRGVEIIESPDLLPGMGRSGWDPYDTLRRMLVTTRKNGFDLVHGFDCRPAVIFPALAMKRATGSPFLSDWADWWGRGGIIQERGRLLRWTLGPVETYLEERFRCQADAVTVTSRALQDRAVGLGLDRRRVHYVPSGSDVETIQPLPKPEMRKRIGLAEDGKVIGYVGFINYDVECMIRAFPHVQARFPEATLLLVGQRYAVTQQLCRENRITRGIREVGIVPFEQLPLYLACADVLLLPFTNKICNIGRGPIKLGDYMAAGRPIITQPVGDLRAVFTEDDPIGLLAGDSPEEFARAICELLSDPERAEQYGRNARRLAEEKYSWQKLTERLEACYASILYGRGRVSGIGGRSPTAPHPARPAHEEGDAFTVNEPDALEERFERKSEEVR